MQCKAGDTIVIRAATPALGFAPAHLSRQAGATILATTRSESKLAFLQSEGASQVLIESEDLGSRVRAVFPNGVDSVLDLVGNFTILDSLCMARRAGHVCAAGFLGGATPVSLDLLSGFAPGPYLTFFVSILLGTPDYPVTNIPLQSIVDSVSRGAWRAAPTRIFTFEQLPNEHRLMESDAANRKIVVTLAR